MLDFRDCALRKRMRIRERERGMKNVLWWKAQRGIQDTGNDGQVIYSLFVFTQEGEVGLACVNSGNTICYIMRKVYSK